MTQDQVGEAGGGLSPDTQSGDREEDSPLTRRRGGLESSLEVSASVVLILGLGFGVWLAVVTLNEGGWLGLAVAVPGWIAWRILQSLAEIIRLQKRANGLPYSGTISKTEEAVQQRCPGCDAVHYETGYCPHCNRAVAE